MTLTASAVGVSSIAVDRVIGRKRLTYDVWGDTVNVASRMESTGEPGRVQVSEAFAQALRDSPGWNLEVRTIEVKGKGEMQTYWLEQI